MSELIPLDEADYAAAAEYAEQIKAIGTGLDVEYPKIDFEDAAFSKVFFDVHFAGVQKRLAGNDRITAANAYIIDQALTGNLTEVHHKLEAVVEIVSEQSETILKRALAYLRLYNLSNVGTGAAIKESPMFEELVGVALPKAIAAEAASFTNAAAVMKEMGPRHQKSLKIAQVSLAYDAKLGDRKGIDEIVVPGYKEKLSDTAHETMRLAQEAINRHENPDFGDLIKYILDGQNAVTAMNIVEEESIVQQYVVSAAQLAALTSAVTYVDLFARRGLLGSLYSAQKKALRLQFKAQMEAALLVYKNATKMLRAK